MQHNQDMLENHKVDWGEKVRIVGISLDDKKDDVVKRVNEKNWKLVDHFFLGGWNEEHNAMKNYQFDGIPYVVLIDGKGKVVFAGNPNVVDLEQKMDLLAKDEQLREKSSLKTLNELLSKKVVDLLNKEEFKEVKYDLTIRWKKEINFDVKGEILNFSYEKPTLSLKYHIKNEAAVKKMEEALYTLINDKSLIEAKSTVENPKDAFDFCVKTLKNELSLNGLTEAEIVFQNSKCYEFQGDSIVCEKNKAFSQKNVIKVAKKEQKDSFSKSFGMILAKNDINRIGSIQRFQLSCKLEKGDDFLPFEVEDIFSENKTLLKHEDNEVLLVDFWATWCGPCQKPMAHNQEMLEKNLEKWQNKVRIVSVSLDNDKQAVVSRVNEKNWKKVIHYFLGSNKIGISGYGVKGIPEVVLINQKGKIVYKGNPINTKLEDNINDLLEGKSLEVESKNEEEKANLKTFIKEDAKMLNALLKDPKFEQEFKEIFSGLKYQPKFCLNINQEILFDDKMDIKEVKYHNPELSFSLRKSELSKFVPILSKIYEAVSNEKLKEEKNIIETVNLKFGSECEACKNQLKPFDPQYYCPFCKFWFCAECGDKVDETKTGNDRLIHPHNMVWINISDEEGLKDIDEYKFGKNITYNENCQNFPASCNGCEGSVSGGYRFICISCRPGPTRPGGFVDMCHKCMTDLRDKQLDLEKKREEILKNLDNEKHEAKSHLWLRICYGNNYYNY